MLSNGCVIAPGQCHPLCQAVLVTPVSAALLCAIIPPCESRPRAVAGLPGMHSTGQLKPLLHPDKPSARLTSSLKVLAVALVTALSLAAAHVPFSRRLLARRRAAAATRRPVRIPCAAPRRAPVALGRPPPAAAAVHPALHRALFADYVAFHRRQRACLERRGLTSPLCAPVLLWTCPESHCAGTGDRLRGVQFAYILAAATRRVLLVDMTDPAAISAVLEPAAVDWTLPPELAARHRRAAKLYYLDVPRLPWWACYGERTCHMKHHVANVSDLPAVPVRPVHAEKDIDPASFDLLTVDFASVNKRRRLVAVETRLWPVVGYFLINPHFRKALLGNQASSYENIAQNTSETALLRAIAHALFRPSKRVSSALRSSWQALGDPYDAVHARLGGDFGEQRDSRFHAINKDLQKTARTVLDCLALQRKEAGLNESRSVYLASDSRQFKATFTAMASRRGLKVVTNDHRALHVSQSQIPRVWKNKKEEKKMCEGFNDVFADMWALGSAEILVGTRSGFADLATRVGKTSIYADTALYSDGRTTCEKREERIGLSVDAQQIRRAGKRRRR